MPLDRFAIGIAAEALLNLAKIPKKRTRARAKALVGSHFTHGTYH
jgi:hypothetical protein